MISACQQKWALAVSSYSLQKRQSRPSSLPRLHYMRSHHDSSDEEEQLELALARSIIDQGGAPASTGVVEPLVAGVGGLTLAIGQLNVTINVASGGASSSTLEATPEVRPRFTLLSSRAAADYSRRASRGEDFRFYSVWGEQLAIAPGIYIGAGAAAYHGVLSVVGGAFGRVQFKRSKNIDEAVAVYAERVRSRKLGCSAVPVYYLSA